MRKYEHNGKIYQIPDVLKPFQEEMYLHLIDWKWEHNTKDRGEYVFKGRTYEYDTILPDRLKKMDENLLPHIYPTIRKKLADHYHRAEFTFRIHPHFYHMSSSQAANANLFLPILEHPNKDLAVSILSKINPEINSIARDHFDNGFKLEYWGAPHNVLGDHNENSGTDSDIAIAFYNHSGELCLWLVEHKLCEKEFTECGGFESENRVNKYPECDCNRPFNDIIANKELCYYTASKKLQTNYWDITEKNKTFFSEAVSYQQCPFQGGMNQLWRNQLLGMAIEADSRYDFKHVYFSVVHHPRSTMLNATIASYKALIKNNPKFSEFTSRNFVAHAEAANDPDLTQWALWYKSLYNV